MKDRRFVFGVLLVSLLLIVGGVWVVLSTNPADFRPVSGLKQTAATEHELYLCTTDICTKAWVGVDQYTDPKGKVHQVARFIENASCLAFKTPTNGPCSEEGPPIPIPGNHEWGTGTTTFTDEYGRDFSIGKPHPLILNSI